MIQIKSSQQEKSQETLQDKQTNVPHLGPVLVVAKMVCNPHEDELHMHSRKQQEKCLYQSKIEWDSPWADDDEA